MMLFTAIIEVEVNPRTRIRDVVSPKAQLGTVNIVVKAMIKATAQHLVSKECSKCGRKNHFKAVHKSNGSNDK